VNEKNEAMSDQLPDRLSTDPKSPYYNADILARDVGIRFKGIEKTNVEEYCISQGSLRQPADDQGSRPGRTVFSRQESILRVVFRHCEQR
jgi:hypothetical protein